MPDAAKFCRWVTCPKEALDQQYLCEEHLASVLKGNPRLGTTVREIVVGLGIGLAGNAIYGALKDGWLLNIGPIIGNAPGHPTPESSQPERDPEFDKVVERLNQPNPDPKDLDQVIAHLDQRSSKVQEALQKLFSSRVLKRLEQTGA